MNFEKLKQLDLLGAVGLRPKKDNPDIIYGGFNRRMMAATIDSFIALLTLAPLVDFLLGYVVRPESPLAQADSLAQLQQLSAALNSDAEMRTEILKQSLYNISFTDILLTNVAQISALLLASAICWKLWSATPGKLIMRMKIVDATTGEKMSDKQIVIRSLGYIVSCALLFLGIFWIAFDKRRQGWHDKMANTVVVNIRKEKTEEVAS